MNSSFANTKQLTLILLAVFTVSFLGTALAQTRVVSPQSPVPKREQKDEIAQPKNLNLVTSDNVTIVATYYAGPVSKETPCILLIHDWGDKRETLFPLAEYLQKEKECSVLVPDLRGHGDSRIAAGVDKKLSYSKFKKNEIASVVLDLERCKKYLMARNNDGELNIELLGIVTVGSTAIHGMQWAVDDWAWPMAPGGLKQGQDVKLFTMVGPKRRLEGLSMNQNLKSALLTGKGQPPLPIQIVWARNHGSSEAEANAIYGVLKKNRRKLKDNLLQMSKVASNLAPDKLLNDQEKGPVAFQKIAAEIDEVIISNKETMVWVNRGKKK